MAYTVLARRYRSNTFDEVVGQNHIAQTLKRAISSGRLAHAFLFCGTRGTGKTSTARILAKCLNCLASPDGPATEPCLACDSCRAIARGEDIDVVEIDAASHTGVDNIRETIIASAYNTPARGRFKVFLIDEVHMLSKNAFNALLKTLEEPPSHVKFILATTEPEKVLPTILSRCQRYDFRNIPAREIAGHLKAICGTERIEADDDALLLVAKAGAGSMRDSLSLLDRLLSVGETHLTVDLLEQMLGLPKSQLVFDLVAAISTGDVKGTLARADAMIADGLAVDTLIGSTIDHLRNLMLLRTCGAESNLVEVPGLSVSDLAAQAGRFDAAALSQDIVLLEELRRHVRQSQAGRALLDATLVRLALADQFSSLHDLLNQATGGAVVAQKKKPSELTNSSERRTSNLEHRTSEKEETPASPNTLSAPTPSRQAPAPLSSVPAVEAPPSLDDDDDDDLPAPGKAWDGPRESLSSLMAKHTAAAVEPEPSNVEPVRSADLTEQWRALLALMAEQGPALTGLLQNGQFIGVRDGRAVVQLPHGNETFLKLFEKGNKKEIVQAAFSRVLNESVGVHFEVAPVGAAVPASPKPVVPPSIAPQAPSQAPAPAAPAAPPRTTPAARFTPPPPPPPVAAEPAATTIRLTDDLRNELYKSDPLIRAIVDQLGGSVIKLEE